MPDPLKFCSVTLAAPNRAWMDAVELSVGNEKGTVGLLMTCPALRLPMRLWEQQSVSG